VKRESNGNLEAAMGAVGRGVWGSIRWDTTGQEEGNPLQFIHNRTLNYRVSTGPRELQYKKDGGAY